MQYEQSDLQYKELQRLDRATEENRIALDFQRREQFLTARLNATLALIQAREIEARAAQGTGETRRDEFAEESLQLRHQVGILLAESDLMFDNSVPNDKLQIISIKNYIHDITYKFKRNYNIYKMAPGVVLMFIQDGSPVMLVALSASWIGGILKSPGYWTPSGTASIGSKKARAMWKLGSMNSYQNARGAAVRRATKWFLTYLCLL